MSQENVEVVRKHIEAFRQGDALGALSHLDPYVVWDASRIGLLESQRLWRYCRFAFADWIGSLHADLDDPRHARLRPCPSASRAACRVAVSSAPMSGLQQGIRRQLTYIPRFIHHFRQRRQLGQSVVNASRSARERMRHYP